MSKQKSMHMAIGSCMPVDLKSLGMPTVFATFDTQVIALLKI